MDSLRRVRTGVRRSLSVKKSGCSSSTASSVEARATLLGNSGRPMQPFFFGCGNTTYRADQFPRLESLRSGVLLGQITLCGISEESLTQGGKAALHRLVRLFTQAKNGKAPAPWFGSAITRRVSDAPCTATSRPTCLSIFTILFPLQMKRYELSRLTSFCFARRAINLSIQGLT